MSLTKSVLASHIKDLECRASEVAVKYSKALQYGLCSSDCLYKKLFIANKSIDILKRFYREGKNCEGECNLTTNTWVLTHVCGYLNTPYTTYTCYYSYVDATIQWLVNSLWEFDASNVYLTQQDGTESQGTYTYNSTTGIIDLSTLALLPYATVVVEFSDDCSTMTLTYDNPSNAQTIIGYFENTGTTHTSCDWEEFCLTEEEVEDLISQTREILGAKCSCN